MIVDIGNRWLAELLAWELREMPCTPEMEFTKQWAEGVALTGYVDDGLVQYLKENGYGTVDMR